MVVSLEEPPSNLSIIFWGRKNKTRKGVRHSLPKTRLTLHLFYMFTFLSFIFVDKQNDKPGYVENNHLSSPAVAGRLKRPT